MSEEKTEKLYEKLRKLMALKDSALNVGSVGEAEAAAAAIQRLLREYNLSEEQIPTEERVTNPLVIQKMPYYYAYKNQWFAQLIVLLCDMNLCAAIRSSYKKGNRTTNKELSIVGRKMNVEMVTFLSLQLANKFVYFCRQAYADYRREQLYKGITPSSELNFAYNFLMGCVSGLEDKLQSQQVASEQGLVLSRKAEIMSFLKNSFANLHEKSTTRVKKCDNRMMFESGYDKGLNVEINKGIDQQKPEQRSLR